MTMPAKAAIAFGLYEIISGFIILLAPEFVSGLLGFTPTNSPWVRVIGIILIEMGALYVVMGMKNVTAFWAISAYSRIFSAILYASLVVLAIAEKPMLLFVALDLFTGLHMWWITRPKPALA